MKQFVAARVVEAFGEKLLAREHLSTKGKWPSLEEVEVSGKRVVVLANRNLGNVAHEMEFKTFKQWTMGTCKENNQMLAVLAEDSTVLNVPFLADPVYNASSVYGVVDDWEWVRKCGVQMILGGIDEAKARKMLWSWDIDAGFPEIDTRKRCAIMALSNRDNSFRIQNARCFGKGSQQRFHLCRKVTDRSVWKRSRTETTYFEPQCPEGFIFSAPISYSEYMSLYESAIAPALKDGLKSAWINYSAPTAFNCWTTGASHISPCVKDFPLNKSLDVGVVANLTLVDVSISSTEIIKKILHAFPMASKQVRILNRENEKIQLLFHPENSVGKASVLENYAVFELGRMGLLNDLLISKNVLFSDSEIIALEKCLVSENSVWSITCNESEPPLDSVGQHGKWWTNLPLWIQILISFGIFTLLFSLISSTIILVKRRNNRGDKKVKGPLDSSLSSNESYSVNEPLQNSSNEALSGKGSSESSSRSFQDRNNQRKKLFSP